MCNCGSKRNTINNGSQAASSSPSEAKMWSDVRVKYTGKTALSVTGNITGNRYRFSQPGSELMVNFRDLSGLLQLPMLKKV